MGTIVTVVKLFFIEKGHRKLNYIRKDYTKKKNETFRKQETSKKKNQKVYHHVYPQTLSIVIPL